MPAGSLAALTHIVTHKCGHDRQTSTSRDQEAAGLPLECSAAGKLGTSLRVCAACIIAPPPFTLACLPRSEPPRHLLAYLRRRTLRRGASPDYPATDSANGSEEEDTASSGNLPRATQPRGVPVRVPPHPYSSRSEPPTRDPLYAHPRFARLKNLSECASARAALRYQLMLSQHGLMQQCMRR